MKINYYLKYWLPVILYACFIFYLSSLSNPIEQIIYGKKILSYLNLQHFIYHIIELGILSLLLYRALKPVSKNPQTLSILIAILYAITDELHQYFVPGRISSVFDLAVDAFGAITVQCIINVYTWLKKI